MNIIYEAEMTSTGGRDGRSVSPDNKLELALSTPTELGGAGGEGTNPEQLFAAGYSACFIGATKFVAAQQKLSLPDDFTITAHIGIGENPKGVGFSIAAKLDVRLPGMDQTVANKLVEDAHQVCPYSNATRNNIDVTFSIAV